MNYFELFEIPISFTVDNTFLTRRYYELSKQYHPDKYTLKSTNDQLHSLNKSTEINNAYRVLKNESERIKYVLELLGVKFKEGQEKISQEFLMEMMDFNEAIMDYKFDPQPSAKQILTDKIKSIKASLSDDFQSVLKNIDIDNPNSDSLELVKAYYLKSKYLSRIEKNFNH